MLGARASGLLDVRESNGGDDSVRWRRGKEESWKWGKVVRKASRGGTVSSLYFLLSFNDCALYGKKGLLMERNKTSEEVG